MTEETRKMIVRIVSIMCVTGTALVFNCQSFDENEIRVLSWLGGFLGIGGIAEAISNRTK